MSVREIHDEIARHPAVAAVRAQQTMERPLVLAGVALLLLSWAAVLYVKTGDLQLTLFGLIAANLASCAAILISRTGKLF